MRYLLVPSVLIRRTSFQVWSAVRPGCFGSQGALSRWGPVPDGRLETGPRVAPSGGWSDGKSSGGRDELGQRRLRHPDPWPLAGADVDGAQLLVVDQPVD